MAIAKGWLIGCGGLVIVAGIAGILGLAYLANQAGDVIQDVQDARRRYLDTNRDYPFAVQEGHNLEAQRFEDYLQVRAAVESAVAPIGDDRGVLGQLSLLTSLPDQVSRAHSEALRQHAMSIAEYRWISRQIYTTVAAEEHRSDPDPVLVALAEDLEDAMNRQDGFRVETDTSSRNPFRSDLLDFTWLRVPDSTRDLIRANAGRIGNTTRATLADTILFNLDFDSSGR